MMNIRQLDLMNLNTSDLAGINEVLNNAAGATVFHTVEWNRLLIDEFGLNHVALLATDQDVPVGMYIYYEHKDNTYKSPVVNLQSAYGGPLAIDDNPNVILKLLDGSEKLHPIAAFQIWTPPNVNPTPFREYGYSVQEMYTPILDLECSEEEQWSRLHRKKRATIRKALKHGAEVVETNSSDLDAYRQMVAETLGKDEIDPLPIDFYHRVMDELAPLGLARLFTVKLRDQPISGSIVLCYKGVIYGWDIGWDREYAHLSPNDLLVWGMCQFASQKGYRSFDLLRIERGRLPGIAKWKESFGGDVIPCYLFQKATVGFRLFRPAKILFTKPSRAIRKVKTFLNGGSET